jgi:hypothetical protein
MTPRHWFRFLVAALWVGAAMPADAGSADADADSDAAERGRLALTGRSHLPPAWGLDAFTKVRAFWDDDPDAPDPERDPAGFAAAFNQRYGLHPAPFPNDGLPMGLRRSQGPDGRVGLTLDCLVCHGGSIGGTSYVGLGNTQLDLRALLTDLTRADGKTPPFSLFTLNSARGTNNAGQIAATLLSLRDRDLGQRRFPLLLGAWLPELDTPPWWNLALKKTKYYDGRTDARAHRSNMQFLLGDLSADEFKALEPTYRDIDAYLKGLAPPPYPFPIDRERADRGRAVFEANCVRCHGSYGPNGAVSYPNKVIPIDVIGTDASRLKGLSDGLVEHYNATWLGADYPVEEPMIGYQAPPLRGVWASAPYLHNGSVPTLYHVLKSSERPDRFRRPPSTAFEHYDQANVGWKFEPVDEKANGTDMHRFDSSRFGLGNGGHAFGDRLSEADRRDLIEYLKGL